VINAALAWLFAQPADRQKAIVAEGMALLGAMLGAVETEDTERPTNPAEEPIVARNEIDPPRVVAQIAPGGQSGPLLVGHVPDPQSEPDLPSAPKRSGKRSKRGA
jgi:hypothetical protein